ncbi:MAG: YidC/Oxa1 family insertase periplasmic-domain containing protein [bacterium]|nr:YidC/Oxa1 family insertase periplasmic-domain containing protein [bacterium]
MKEETRIIIAFGLALLVIMFFSMTSPKNRSSENEQPRSIEQPVFENIQSQELPEISEKMVEIKNNFYTASIDLLGGKIVYFALNQYKRPGEENFLFFQKGNTLLDMVGGETIQQEYRVVSPAMKDTLVMRTIKNGIEFEKVIQYASSRYSMDVVLRQRNATNKTVNVHGITISLGSIFLNKRHPEDVTMEFMVLNGNKPTRFNIARQMKEKIPGTICVVKTRYQMYYFKSDQPVEFYVENKDSKINWGFYIHPFDLSAGQEWKFPFVLYIGPSDYFVARNEIHNIKVFGTGFFVSMGRLIFYILSMIHRIVPNWGLAIIMLTILIKIIFFPLTRSSLRSMKQMQKLRPYLQDIQKKYKENPQMMQKEIMNLYKTYKINPFSGCLPMLVQIPIFVGFFLALRNSIFLRGSGFILWIKDLSLPDTVAMIGAIPVNILPILMFITSFLQQRMTPAVDQSQKIMNVMLPLMMLVLFYNFSSGLLLYWVTMNLAGLIEQYYIYKFSKK